MFYGEGRGVPAQVPSSGLKHSFPQLWGVLSAESPQKIGVVSGPAQCYAPFLGRMHPTTGCSRRWALGFHQGELQRLSWHRRQHKMGPHLCYDCCSVQILQATWSGSSSPHRVFVDWTPDKTPISVSETASWGKQPKTSCNHSRNWSSGHYLTWVTQLRRSALNPHILLFPKQDRQLLLLLLRGGWWQMYSSQYRVIQNFSWRVLIWHDHWFQKKKKSQTSQNINSLIQQILTTFFCARWSSIHGGTQRPEHTLKSLDSREENWSTNWCASGAQKINTAGWSAWGAISTCYSILGGQRQPLW